MSVDAAPAHTVSRHESVLVTGAGGFVGSALCSALANSGIGFAGVIRQGSVPCARSAPAIPLDITATTNWKLALQDMRTVVHLANLAHIPHGRWRDADAVLRDANTLPTLNLARQSAESGVRRFVFLSSIKVNGECTAPGEAFDERSPADPRDAYGRAKLATEQGLREIGTASGIEMVFVRAPLVYGPRVKGNFASLARWIDRGLPLPLGAVTNQRSLIALDNLVSFLLRIISHHGTAAGIWTVADGEDLSTPELVRRMAKAMGRQARLINVPPSWLMRWAGWMARPDSMQRLCSSLCVHDSRSRSHFGWAPIISVDEGLHRALRALNG